MKISCPSCSAKYSVADEKIQARLAKIRCRKCAATIVIDGTATPANVYVSESSHSGAPAGAGVSEPSAAAVAAASAPAAGRRDSDVFGALGGGEGGAAARTSQSEPVGPARNEFAVDIADNDQRNMTVAQIVTAYNEGLINGDTYIWREGMADWQTLAEVPDIATALHAAAQADGVGIPKAAAVSEGSSSDLFGGIDRAGGEDDIATSAPQPTAGTGARNESSVLFSLSALTASESKHPPADERKSSDDSGLIDLQALTAAEPIGSSQGGVLGVAPGGFATSPLMSAPLGGVSSPAMAAGMGPGQKGSSTRTFVLVGIGALTMAILVVVLYVVQFRGPAEPQVASEVRPAPTAAPAPASSGTVEVGTAAAAEPIGATQKPSSAQAAGGTEVDELSEPEEDPAEAEDKARTKAASAPAKSAAPKRSAPARRERQRPAPSRVKPVAKAPSPPRSAPPAPAPAKASPKKAPKKKKKSSNCDCKPADLMCAMKCSANR